MSDVGKCCFCDQECNPSSQSCGRCARLVTGNALGWNNLPSYIVNRIVNNNPPIVENTEETKNEV